MTDKQAILLKDRFAPSRKMVSEVNESVSPTGEKGKHWHLKGIFMQSEVENLNGRIYPLDEMTREVERMEQTIKEGNTNVFGELDHPEDLVVNLANVSHFIKEIHMDGNNAVGDIQVIDTVPAGKIVCGLLETPGVNLGVSSRGTGYVDEYDHVVDNFNLVTIDIVATPSAQEAAPMAVFENLRNTAKGQELFQNANDCIRNKGRYTEQLNDDIRSWLINWTPNR